MDAQHQLHAVVRQVLATCVTSRRLPAGNDGSGQLGSVGVGLRYAPPYDANPQVTDGFHVDQSVAIYSASAFTRLSVSPLVHT
jgi:hypothetical protein